MTEADASAAVTPDVLNAADPRRVADRYNIRALLGRGGMASAYRAFDAVTGRTVALKRLTVSGDETKSAGAIALFEREFHTLTQLAHPRVIQTFDYGVDDGQPYYTMELLDGGDLQGLAPLPWREVCMVAYEICSALSLLHSRRLVHRDVTPRNIRRTADRKAKLIDFGLLSPMGPQSVLAGTPPFMPPELIDGVSLDGRSDLFSLGATLYYTLTGQYVFRARRIDQLRDAWRTRPAAPSKLVAGIPTALDEIVLGMLRIDAGSRPKSAAEVMDRLLPLLDHAPDEELSVANAYLTAPGLVGRDAIVESFRKRMLRLVRRRGGGFVVSGEAGLGRSRMLDAFVLEAKLVGATTIRASAANAGHAFGVAATLAAQLYESAPAAALSAARVQPAVYAALFRDPDGAPNADASADHEHAPQPQLIDLTRAELGRAELQVALRGWILAFANQRPLAIAIDDADEIDEPSLALLAALTLEAPTQRLVYAVTLEDIAPHAAPTALAVIAEHAERVPLTPLDIQQTALLLKSVFGDTANIQLLSLRLHALCGGHPRECMALAQYLVSSGVITYGGGSWTVPSEIAEESLPASIGEALGRQVSALSPTARRLAAYLALSLADRLSRQQLSQLDGNPPSKAAVSAAPPAIDAALDQLLELRLVTGGPSGYALRHGGLARQLTARLGVGETQEIHQQLANLHEHSNIHPLFVAYHKLLGQRPEQGLDYILVRAQDSEARTHLSTSAADQLGTQRTGQTLELALREAERLQRPTRDRQALWVMLAGVSAQGEDAGYFYRVPDAWLKQLKHDSGWDDWQKADPSLDPMARVLAALGATSERYNNTPEAERVLSIQDAIKQMVSYVVLSIAIGNRVQDLQLMASLPGLLEPFVLLNPMVAAMFHNARFSGLHALGRREESSAGFVELLAQLDAISGAELAYVDKVRAAVYWSLAASDITLGVKSKWIDLLEHQQGDPNQRVTARYLRKLQALSDGDWEQAESHRQQAELLTLQTNARSMFSTLDREIGAHAMAGDLTGLKHVRARVRAMADGHPGWVAVMHVADAHYLRLCGDLEGAVVATRAARASETGSTHTSASLQAITIEVAVLAELGRAEEALQLAHAPLAETEREGMRFFARGLACSVAIAEAKLGHFEAAMSRMADVIEEQIGVGVTGLQLGHSYELAARIAIWAGDVPAFRKFAALTAEQYRPGQSSVLGALYERLTEEARQAGVDVARSLDPAPAEESEAAASLLRVTTWFAGCGDREERATRALALLCEGEPTSRGHLFLHGEAGLVLVAANAPQDQLAELHAFARKRFELETAEAKTMTALAAATTDLLIAASQWVARDGTRFHATLLSAPMSDGARVAGIAMLTADSSAKPPGFAKLVVAVTHALLESGDAVGVDVE